MSNRRACFLWLTLLVYAIARISQLYASQIPTLLIVELHVIPPALIALAHGSVLYRAKGMSVFVVFCLGFGTLAESLSLRTGFPFGRYYFTDVMGPKILQLPVLLALAYLGIGYTSWILALLILGYADKGYADKPLRGMRVLALPLLASLIMIAWDLSMDPTWSLLDQAWVWQDGGAYFGVPVSNFFGWFFTAYLYYQTFALYCRSNPTPASHSRQGFWAPVVLLYALCALGNTLVLKQPMTPPFVIDAAGRRWLTADILHNCLLVSLLVMLPFALFAWPKTRQPVAEMSSASAGL